MDLMEELLKEYEDEFFKQFPTVDDESGKKMVDGLKKVVQELQDESEEYMQEARKRAIKTAELSNMYMLG